MWNESILFNNWTYFLDLLAKHDSLLGNRKYWGIDLFHNNSLHYTALHCCIVMAIKLSKYVYEFNNIWLIYCCHFGGGRLQRFSTGHPCKLAPTIDMIGLRFAAWSSSLFWPSLPTLLIMYLFYETIFLKDFLLLEYFCRFCFSEIFINKDSQQPSVCLREHHDF